MAKNEEYLEIVITDNDGEVKTKVNEENLAYSKIENHAKL